MRAALLILLLLAASPASADELQLPAAALDRAGPVVAIWRPAVRAPGMLVLDWTDSAGRLIEQHRVTVDKPAPEVAIPLDLRRARLPGNQVTALFQPDGGGPPTRAAASFVARPPPGWAQYQVLLWQDLPQAGLAGLRALGITGTKLLRPISPDGRALAADRIAAGLRWYDENLATDFYAAYHRWRPGLPVTWAFDQARARHASAPEDASVFDRAPSLSDPAWLDTVRARLSEIARLQAPYRPVFLNLGDETGIADLSAAWDFDRSPESLAAMRIWLRGRLGTLAALNRAWGTQFAAWDDVIPATNDAAIRDDAAVPSWMAFKHWMDVAFARAVRAGTDAVHHGDPEALAGLEGGQMPGWGGYDYGLLAPSVDAMEIYDMGNAVEIARSLNPALRVLTTSFAGGPAEQRRLWHEWLLGARGSIVWDETGAVMGADGRPGPRGVELAPVFRALTGARGAQLLDAVPERDRVAILYSQASFRLEWLLARRRDGGNWAARDAEAEDADTPWRAATRRIARLLADLGAPARWITPETLKAGGLARDGVRVLVLPHSLALSDPEISAIRGFAAAGGLVLADSQPGGRDEMGRVRSEPPLAGLARSGRLRPTPATPAALAALLDSAGATAALSLLEPDGSPAEGVDIRLFRSGDAVIAGIQRQDGGPGDGGPGGRMLTLRLPAPLWVQPLGGAAPAMRLREQTLALDPVAPTLLALSAARLPGPTLAGPARAAAGDLVALRLGLDGPTPLAAQFMDITVRDPAGTPVPALSDTMRVPQGGCLWRWPLAVDDRAGTWRVTASDAATGRVAVLEVQVGGK